MAKKKKNKKEEEEIEYIEPEDLDKYDEDDYVLETKWDVFVRNYKTVPGFRAIVKLSIYFILILILVVAANLKSIGGSSKEDKKDETTTEVQVKFSDLLEELLNNKQYKCDIKINEDEYVLNGTYGNNILTGNLYTNDGTYAYKLKDNTVYEVKLKNEVENNTLLKNIDKRIIDNTSLVNLIKNSSGIKVEGGFKYSKVKIDEDIYSIDIGVVNDHIKTISVTKDNIYYKFTFDELFVID